MNDFRLTRGTKLVIATHNDGKLAEFRELFAPFGLDLTSAGELGLPEPAEEGTTFAENARTKAHVAAEASGLMALSDDSGLCIDALNGDPGVYTADWAGVPRDFMAAMQRVEDLLRKKDAKTPAQRRGSFNATLCLALPDGRDQLYVGKAEGTLVWPPRGDKGFGFDPVFQPEGFDTTFGEMTSEEKHSWSPGHVGLSHRARAFAALVEACCDV
ncbi:non-canonical purine NTP pyrophosphatase [Cucumibacter marinus]|uniref:non-canonical purine NTP pyrophosphatase n=1 Tax=Cucumibacter marinus TaxID=1121252 RepID=UPI00041085F6|nr:non-canonical purine NTP pyrophosphatase [Cucumibacter marinus]